MRLIQNANTILLLIVRKNQEKKVNRFPCAYIEIKISKRKIDPAHYGFH